MLVDANECCFVHMLNWIIYMQDYKQAARLRDSLKIFEDEEPVLRLRRLLKEAIAEERFEVPVPFSKQVLSTGGPENVWVHSICLDKIINKQIES